MWSIFLRSINLVWPFNRRDKSLSIPVITIGYFLRVCNSLKLWSLWHESSTLTLEWLDHVKKYAIALLLRNTVKSVLRSTTEQRPPVNNNQPNSHYSSFSDNPLHNDHYFQVSLYTGLTVVRVKSLPCILNFSSQPQVTTTIPNLPYYSYSAYRQLFSGLILHSFDCTLVHVKSLPCILNLSKYLG